jgi:hypothetical protein
MARYSGFLGRRVEVQYRAGDILLPASGTFVADSGRSIFLEQSLLQRGQQKHFRWEIPYQYLVRIEEAPESEDVSGPATTAGSAGSHRAAAILAAPDGSSARARKAAKAAASVSDEGPAMLPLNPPKPA